MILRKLLHILLPIIIILLFSKRFGIKKVGLAAFSIMLLKEVYDSLILNDPLAIFIFDMLLNIIGIAAGIIIVKIAAKHEKHHDSLQK